MSIATFHSPFVLGRPPKWASGFGQDKYGYFAEFSVATGPHYWKFITQRMRWIPAGSFMMGSPKYEVNRDDELQVNPHGPVKGARRVLRGGSWNYAARYARSACRNWGEPHIRHDNMSFRLMSSAS